MANDIRICDKCNHMSIKSVLPKLRKMAPDADIKIGCKSYCGPCGKFAFIYINGRYVSAPSEDEVLKKAERFVRRPVVKE